MSRPIDDMNAIRRLWSHVDKDGPAPAHRPDLGPCWTWTLSVDKDGYGRIKIEGRKYYVHRLSWEIHFGLVPSGLCVCHHCDTPSCVNPAHLWVGTNVDNTADKMAKGRHFARSGDEHFVRRNPALIVRGQAGVGSKLTEQQVRDARRRHQEGHALRSIAEDLHVHKRTISKAVSGQTWAHLVDSKEAT